MKKMSKKIVFFGSGPVAAESLRLLADDFEIEAVITKPRPAHHKGTVPVLELADDLGITVYTAHNKRSLDELFASNPVESEVAILIDFGIIVSQQVIDYFPYGIINSHFSLLPEWRGADPITFSILSGQKETGVSLMLLVAAMDEGPLLAQGIQELSDDATTPQLTHDLVLLSEALLKEIVPLYLQDKVRPAGQLEATQAPSNTPTYSRKLTKEDSQLNFNKPAKQLEREIRAFIEWPKSRTHFGTLEIIITRAHVINASGAPGDTTVIDKKPVVFCGTDALAIDGIKPAGKKEMTGESFLAGYKQIFLG